MFSIEIDATRHLAADADRVEALITLRASSAGGNGHAPRIAEILIMDRSNSMLGHNKIHEALRAASAAVDGLPDCYPPLMMSAGGQVRVVGGERGWAGLAGWSLSAGPSSW